MKLNMKMKNGAPNVAKEKRKKNKEKRACRMWGRTR